MYNMLKIFSTSFFLILKCGQLKSTKSTNPLLVEVLSNDYSEYVILLNEPIRQFHVEFLTIDYHEDPTNRK